MSGASWCQQFGALYVCAFAMPPFDGELALGQCLRKPCSSFLILRRRQLYAFHSRPPALIFFSKLACLPSPELLSLP